MSWRKRKATFGQTEWVVRVGRYLVVVENHRGGSGRDFVRWRLDGELVTMASAQGMSRTIKQAKLDAVSVALSLPGGS